MELTACPHCGLRLTFSGDCVCPGCEQNVSVASPGESGSPANPYVSPQEENTCVTATKGSGLTLGEKIFTAVVILFAGMVLLGLALFHFVVIPESDNPGVFYFVVSIYWLMFGAAAVTTSLNLWKGRLLVIPTFIQSLLLCLTLWLLPAGLAGFYLLFQSEKRQRKQSDLAQ